MSTEHWCLVKVGLLASKYCKQYLTSKDSCTITTHPAIRYRFVDLLFDVCWCPHKLMMMPMPSHKLVVVFFSIQVDSEPWQTSCVTLDNDQEVLQIRRWVGERSWHQTPSVAALRVGVWWRLWREKMWLGWLVVTTLTMRKSYHWLLASGKGWGKKKMTLLVVFYY